MIQIGEEEPQGLFEQKYAADDWSGVFQLPDESVRLTPEIINEAVSAIFLSDQAQRPTYILMLAGNEVYLLEAEKWMRGSYLRFRLEDLFDEASHKKVSPYYSLFFCLCGKEALAPASDIILMEQLDEDAHKSAYEVTKDLKEGVIFAVENLANEAVWFLRHITVSTWMTWIKALPTKLKDDCLTLVYRLLFLFYAESRDDLDILPVNDESIRAWLQPRHAARSGAGAPAFGIGPQRLLFSRKYTHPLSVAA